MHVYHYTIINEDLTLLAECIYCHMSFIDSPFHVFLNDILQFYSFLSGKLVSLTLAADII